MTTGPVLLIHGLGRTPASLALLATRLRRRGFAPAMFGYFAFAQRFPRIVERLRARLQLMAAQGAFSVVTHSMGAVLLRAALHGSGVAPFHVVMLAPPNRPPRMARWAVRVKPFTWLAGDSGSRLADSAFYEDLPGLDVSYTIIAGTRGVSVGPLAGEPNDGVVAVSETSIRDDDEVIRVAGTHTFLMNRRDVAEYTLSALDTPGRRTNSVRP